MSWPRIEPINFLVRIQIKGRIQDFFSLSLTLHDRMFFVIFGKNTAIPVAGTISWQLQVV